MILSNTSLETFNYNYLHFATDELLDTEHEDSSVLAALQSVLAVLTQLVHAAVTRLPEALVPSRLSPPLLVAPEVGRSASPFAQAA